MASDHPASPPAVDAGGAVGVPGTGAWVVGDSKAGVAAAEAPGPSVGASVSGEAVAGGALAAVLGATVGPIDGATDAVARGVADGFGVALAVGAGVARRVKIARRSTFAASSKAQILPWPLQGPADQRSNRQPALGFASTVSGLPFMSSSPKCPPSATHLLVPDGQTVPPGVPVISKSYRPNRA